MASNIWFISDTHFWHHKVIQYQRPCFKNVVEMNETIISNWNSVVKPSDLVYFLGDFSFCGTNRSLDILNVLNGKIHLIKGNHDRKMSANLRDRFEWVKDIYPLRIDHDLYKGYIELCHFPFLSWAASGRGRYHLFGHAHGKLETDMLSLDVSVERWNYFPVNLDTVLAELEKKKERFEMEKSIETTGYEPVGPNDDPGTVALKKVRDKLLKMTPTEYEELCERAKREGFTG